MPLQQTGPYWAKGGEYVLVGHIVGYDSKGGVVWHDGPQPTAVTPYPTSTYVREKISLAPSPQNIRDSSQHHP